MKQLTHHFSIIPLSQIKSKFRQDVIFVDTPRIFDFVASDPVTLEPGQQEDDSGYYYHYDFSAVVNDKEIMKCNGQRAVLRLKLSDGTERYFGEIDAAPIMTVTPHLGKYLVKAALNSRDAVIL